jgi:Lon protease-like protein
MEMPLFPLATVLFPGGVLQLQIFEVRYLDMIGRCWRSGEPFGVTMLTAGTEVRQPGMPDEVFHPVGTLAAIAELASPRPGLMLVQCRATSRFRILSSRKQKNGAWTAWIDPLADDLPVRIPEHLEVTALGLKKVYAALLQGPGSAQLPPEPDWRFDDCGWVANRWCELLPMAAGVRQQLMALDNPLIRLELVTDLLKQTPLDTD